MGAKSRNLLFATMHGVTPTHDWIRTLRRCDNTHQYDSFVNWPNKSDWLFLANAVSHMAGAHRPSRFVGRRAISALYLLARKSQDASSHIDRVDSSIDVRYLLCICWPENHKMHHRNRVDSSVDVRYLFCICWPENQDASSNIYRPTR